MNPKLIFVGFLLITLSFAGGFWFLLASRSQQLRHQSNQNQPGVTTVIDYPDHVPQEVLNEVAQDVYSQEILLRGQIVSYNAESRLLSIIHSSRDSSGLVQEELRDVSLSNLPEVLCWSATTFSSSGLSIQVRDAYFPLTAQSRLFMEGELTTTLDAIASKLPGHYGLVLINPSITPNQVAIAKQLTVLNLNLCKSSVPTI